MRHRNTQPTRASAHRRRADRATRARTAIPRRGLSLESLVAERGRGTFLTPELWDRLMAMAAVEHPAIAEFSWSTQHFWNRADLMRVFRIGRFLVVPLGAGPKHMMVIAMPGATLTRIVREALGRLMLEHELRYVPEATALRLAPVVEDVGASLLGVRDDADYVYGAASLAELDGPGYGSRGKAVRRFDRTYFGETDLGRVDFREGLLSDRWAFEHLLATCERWARKFEGHPPAEVEQELLGIRSWPRAAHGQRLPLVAMWVDGQPAGVSVREAMWGQTWMGLVFKTDTHRVPGSGEALRRHLAGLAVLAMGPRALINVQQDAGEPGLRVMKGSYHPVLMREKFAVILPDRTPSFDLEGNAP